LGFGRLEIPRAEIPQSLSSRLGRASPWHPPLRPRPTSRGTHHSCLPTEQAIVRQSRSQAAYRGRGLSRFWDLEVWGNRNPPPQNPSRKPLWLSAESGKPRAERGTGVPPSAFTAVRFLAHRPKWAMAGSNQCSFPRETRKIPTKAAQKCAHGIPQTPRQTPIWPT
jgi:hypothetical protein